MTIMSLSLISRAGTILSRAKGAIYIADSVPRTSMLQKVLHTVEVPKDCRLSVYKGPFGDLVNMDIDVYRESGRRAKIVAALKRAGYTRGDIIAIRKNSAGFAYTPPSDPITLIEQHAELKLLRSRWQSTIVTPEGMIRSAVTRFNEASASERSEMLRDARAALIRHNKDQSSFEIGRHILARKIGRYSQTNLFEVYQQVDIPHKILGGIIPNLRGWFSLRRNVQRLITEHNQRVTDYTDDLVNHFRQYVGPPASSRT